LAYSCDAQKKAEQRKLASLKQSAVLIAFFLRFSGPINGDPSVGYLIASRWGLRELGYEHQGLARSFLLNQPHTIMKQRAPRVALKFLVFQGGMVVKGLQEFSKTRRVSQLRRSLTNHRVAGISVSISFLGALVMFFAEGIETVWMKSGLSQIGGLICATGLLSFVWDVASRRAFLEELLELLGLGDAVNRSGIFHIGMEAFEGVNFETLIIEATKMDVYVCYADTWRKRYERELRQLAAKPGVRIRLIVPDVGDADLMLSLAKRFGKKNEQGAPDPSKMKAQVYEAVEEYCNFFDASKNVSLDFSLWYHDDQPTISFYRFDNIAVCTLYKSTKGRNNVPTFVARRPGFLYNFVEKELDTLIGAHGGVATATRCTLAEFQKRHRYASPQP
jgi:hypothetical protein